MKWNEADMDDHRVIVAEGFFDDLEDVPTVGGIFIFVDAKLDVKYIGAAPDGHLHNAAKSAFETGKGTGATQLGWARTFSYSKALSLCSDLKEKYNPPNN
jgi:hypothetical protein